MLADYGMGGVATVTLAMYGVIRAWRFARTLMFPRS